MRINLTDAKFYRPEMQLLDLHGQQLQDKDVASITAFLEQHPEIIELDLSDNLIGDEGATLLAETAQLRVLDLSGNKLGDKGAIALSSCTTLQSLNVRRNPIGVEGCKALNFNVLLISLRIDEVKRVRKLDELDIASLPKRLRAEAKKLEDIIKYKNETFSHEYYEDNLIQAIGLQILMRTAIYSDAKVRQVPTQVLHMLGCAYLNYLKRDEYHFPEVLVNYLSLECKLTSDIQIKQTTNDLSEGMSNLLLGQDELWSALLCSSVVKKLKLVMQMHFPTTIIKSTLIDLGAARFGGVETDTMTAFRGERKLTQELASLVNTTDLDNEKPERMQNLANEMEEIIRRINNMTEEASGNDIYALRQLGLQIKQLLISNRYDNEINAIVGALIHKNETLASYSRLTAFHGFHAYVEGDLRSTQLKGEIENEKDKNRVCDESKVNKLIKVVDAHKPNYPFFKMLVSQLKMNEAELGEVKARATNQDRFAQFCLQLQIEQSEDGVKLMRIS